MGSSEPAVAVRKMTHRRAVATLLPVVGPVLTDVVTARSCGWVGAPPGAYSRVTAALGETTSKVIESGTSLTMPMGPWGTSPKSSCGVSRVIDGSSHRSTSTFSLPWVTTKPRVCHLSTSVLAFSAPRSQRTWDGSPGGKTSLGRGTGHQRSAHALKSACHGSASGAVIVPGARPVWSSRNGSLYAASRMGRDPADRPPASIPG